MKKPLILFGGLVAILLLALTLLITKCGNIQSKERIAQNLNIKNPPNSLSIIECESPFTTDVLETCILEIDPSEFEILLSGYKFKKRNIVNTSHSVVEPNLGTEFKITEEYSVEPKEFEHGGYIKIFTDKQHEKLIFDLYIE